MTTVVRNERGSPESLGRHTVAWNHQGLLLFSLADGTTVTGDYLPCSHLPSHIYRVTDSSGAVIGEFTSLKPVVDLLWPDRRPWP